MLATATASTMLPVPALTLTLPQFALAWVLREPNVASAIVGASRPDQVTDNAKASGLVIDPALFAKAEAILATLPAFGDMPR